MTPSRALYLQDFRVDCRVSFFSDLLLNFDDRAFSFSDSLHAMYLGLALFEGLHRKPNTEIDLHAHRMSKNSYRFLSLQN